MENKVIFEGVILNQPKITDFGSTLLRVKNTQTFKKKDGTQGESTYTAVVSVEWRKLAEEVVSRFKQNDLVHIEGSLKKKNTKKVDQDGNEIYETWIKASVVNALPHMQSVNMNLIPEAKPKGAPYVAQKTPTKIAPQPMKQQPAMQIPLEDPDNLFEEVYDNDLPF